MQRIAIIGSGISGMSAAWLLSQRYEVSLFEAAPRIGGHTNTVLADVGGRSVPVDTGFIVYNEPAYPNLTALFAHLGVKTEPSDMSLGVSLDGGRLEYSGDPGGVFAQKRNLLSPRFWSMLRGIVRFYREAGAEAGTLAADTTLRQYLSARGYSDAFVRDHLLPMAGAIWSAPAAVLGDYPAAAFIRFQENHGLLKLAGRTPWRTVTGGSRAYVEALTQSFKHRIGAGRPVVGIARDGEGVVVRTAAGEAVRFDHVVLATHADQALALLDEPSPAERRLLGPFRYSRNRTFLHTDAALMPKRRRVWSSWNYLGRSDAGPGEPVTVTYWMNRLQRLPTSTDLFVTLNPPAPPAAGTVLREEMYEHPVFDAGALRAQRDLWSLQGGRRTWFCGAYFGAGFHEDGLQAGLAVAEAMGAPKRPWQVAGESDRICIAEAAPALPALEEAA